MQRNTFLTTLLSTAIVAVTSGAHAEVWPSRPVKLVLGTPAGTAPDTAARIVAERLGALWAQPVVVENRTGAGGMIAMEYVKSSNPDAYTLVFAHSGAVVVTPKLIKAAKYDPINDFTTIGYVADSPMMIAVNNEVVGKTLPDLVKAAKANPGLIPFGSTEQATLPYLVGHGIADATGVEFQHVPFNQPAQAIQALVKGDVQYYVDGIAPLLPLVKAGRIKAVAVTSDKPLPGLEDIPLVKDAVPGYVAVGWFALLGPKTMPAEIASKINRDLNQVLAQSEVVAKMREISLFPALKSQLETQNFLKTEVDRWGAVIRKAGVVQQ